MHKDYIQRLAQLVAIPSISSANPQLDTSNQAVVEILAQWLQPLGFHCQLHPIPHHSGKYNLIAQRGSGPGGLVLAGHTDTVPCNPDRWQQNPFTLTQRHNALYGLGATDMKGFFPAVIAAVERLNHLPFQHPLFILATADEESSMSGARALSHSHLPHARYAIIGEPTGLKPIRMHKGILMEAINIQGLAGHSSNPALGHNALDAMHQVITQLIAFRQQLQHQHQNPGFSVPTPTLNLGCIHGGDNPNRICGHCQLQFDLRPLPGMSNEELRHAIRQQLTPIAERTHTQIELTPLFQGINPFEEPAQSPFVQHLQTLSGHSAESANYATEAPFLQHLGLHTLVWGPGSINQAHQPDEYIELSQITPYIDQLEQLIGHYCVTKTPTG